MTTLYISGPITGYDDLNRPAFQDAAERLRAAGYTVINPHDNNLPAGSTWLEHMRADIIALMGADGVATLQGHTASRGATVEVRLALDLDLPVRTVKGWIAMKEVRSAALFGTPADGSGHHRLTP